MTPGQMSKVIQNAEVEAYLLNAPLYQEVLVEGAEVEDMGEAPFITVGDSYRDLPPPKLAWQVPEVLKRACPRCEALVTWERTSDGAVEPGQQVLSFLCRSCKRESLSVWLRIAFLKKGPPLQLIKIGQDPKLEVVLPKDFERALGARADLYRKGMTSRHNGYGIGALTYLRRLIEETTDEMLVLLEGALEAENADGPLLKLREARDGKAFDDKVKLAAEILPASLRPGGVNPFGDLYGLLSIGLHGLGDGECCDIVDGMDNALKHIYKRLKVHAEEEKEYRAAVKRMNEKVGKLKQREQ